MRAMIEKDNFALVPKPPSSLRKAELGRRGVLSDMVADALALANKAHSKPARAKFRIGKYEWCEAHYRQVLIWAEALRIAG